jgi:hypothetical protein
MTTQNQHVEDSTIQGSILNIENMNIDISRPARIPSVHDPFPATDGFVGRSQEVRELKELLLAPKPHVIQLVAHSGHGKTILAAKALDELRLKYYRLDLTRSTTVHAAGVRLYEILYQLSDPQKSFADIVALVMAKFREIDHILVLDNIHCLLGCDSRGEDEDTGMLLRRLAECGRKILSIGWINTNAYGKSRQKIVTYPITGLSPEASIQKLKNENVNISEGDEIPLKRMAERVMGNPQMLEIMAGIIIDRGGNVQSILQDDNWISEAIEPFDAPWNMLSADQRQVLIAVKVLGLKSSLNMIASLLGLDGGIVKRNMKYLQNLRLVRMLEPNGEVYMLSHDLIEEMIKRNADERQMRVMHRSAGDLILEKHNAK